MPDLELSDRAGTIEPKKRNDGREDHVGPRETHWVVTVSYQVNIETPCVNENKIYQTRGVDEARVCCEINSTRNINQGRLQVWYACD